MAKAIVLEQFNGPDFEPHLKLKDIPEPEPKAGEVLLEPYLRPVNPTDVLLLSGAYGTSFQLPLVPGSDGVCKVVKNGEGCSKFTAGDRVVVVQWPQFASNGSWATRVCVPEKDVFAVSAGISDETASQFFINPCTVYGMLKELAVPKGEYLLQAAAGSVLGRQVISLAKHYGIKTINVVRRSDAVDELKALGADEVIATDKEDIMERVTAITGGAGAYACLDPVGGKLAGKMVGALRKGGTYMAYGLLDPNPMELNIIDLIAGKKIVKGFIIYEWIEGPHKEEVVKEVMKLLEDSVIDPYSGEKFPMADYAAAIKKSQEVGRGGKVFLDSRQ